MTHPPPFNILVAAPHGVVHTTWLAGTARMLAVGFERLGLSARIAVNEFLHDGTNIVLAAHNLDESLVGALPRGTIVYNTEMVVPGSPFIRAMLPFVRAFETWDYSSTNVRHWTAMDIGARVRFVRPAYLPYYTAVDLDHRRDVDVLFYGLMSPRRERAIAALRGAGLEVRALTHVYGTQLDDWIARTRILLNVHHADTAVFEFARLSTAFANRRCFVTEVGGDGLDDVEPALRAGVAAASYAELPALCRALVDDASRREAIAHAGYDAYRRTDFSRNLAQALGMSQPPAPAARP